MKIALCQMNVTEDKEVNLKHACEMVRRAKRGGADMAVLPEMFPCIYAKKQIHEAAEEEGGLIWQTMSGIAREEKILLAAGSMPERSGTKVYNTAYVFDPEGHQIAKHRKVHLFDINVPGGQVYMESDIVGAGNEVTVFETPFGRMGLAICYDVRFPELFRLMADKGAKCFIIPASFNQTTGPAHWELLMRARALDQGAYVFGCAGAVNPEASYSGWGHSIAVSPWGEVMGQLGADENILFVQTDDDYQMQVRSAIPVLSQRRGDLYELIERS